ncbi:MAG TPA: cell wall-binding repeat-containing protein [Egibacteraceae bacterium]|nr:cell wall-binding repeat-containing protein [Egibacteraceae bacterium]
MRLLAAAAACLAVLAGGAAPAAAHPLAHPGGPRVVNLRPAPGDVVGAGSVLVAALVTSDEPLTSVRVTVDGAEVVTTSSGGSHPTVSATATLAPGDHLASVGATDGRGRATERAWRFTVTGLRVHRLAGADRLETAVAMSRDLYPAAGSAPEAVLARADDFPDALAGAPLAARVDGPLLLTDRQALSAATGEELRRVVAAGGTVHLLGGPSALSDQVEADVTALGFSTRRLAGQRRFGTAVEIARLSAESQTAVIAAGATFADALAVSAPAAARGYPILLTGSDFLPGETRDFLASADMGSLLVVGGVSAVGEAVVEELEGIVGTGNVTRLAGAGRYDTAAAVAEHFAAATQTAIATVAVAAGDQFPDALAGGRHAAGLGVPLLLSPQRGLLAPQAGQVALWGVDDAVVYGGRAALSAVVDGDLRRALVNLGAPQVVRTTPAGAEVHTLEQIVIEFDRDVRLDASSLYVTLAGNEVAGTLSTGDFPNTVIFSVAELPEVVPGVRYQLRIVGEASAGAGWGHFERWLTFVKLDLSLGDAGPAVADLQHRLAASGYWVGPVDGLYGTLTHQAVMALQKVHGLTRDGVYGPATRALLAGSPPRPAPRSAVGLVMEVDKARQVLLMVRDGRVEWVFNTSTGTERPYVYQGRTYLADTPPGQWRITREIDGIREGSLGRLYRPKYFHPDGIAIHGSTSVPAYPASHGCVRVSVQAMDWLWPLVPIGSGVWIY